MLRAQSPSSFVKQGVPSETQEPSEMKMQRQQGKTMYVYGQSCQSMIGRQKGQDTVTEPLVENGGRGQESNLPRFYGLLQGIKASGIQVYGLLGRQGKNLERRSERPSCFCGFFPVFFS
ncbi:ADAMTS9-AS2 isoform 3 [Pongo abelii]|uniref:ADAMTS9-AS2 isoform 3 n=1 Tax=Pongo abelii TaxID=9601 RepID=A0A2J8TEB3_PONAB|nr:ADAMTS9-AS2 isoform 3 [Pongo abelii]